MDSEPLGARVFSQVLAELGYKMSYDQCLHSFKGLTLDDCFRYIEERYKTPLPPDFKTILDKATEKTFALELKAVSGIEKTLKWLEDNAFQKCVASNGQLTKIHNSLNATGLIRYFESIYSAEQVASGKPSPDLFLYAANRCDYRPRDCIVIEDSTVGVTAAIAANMRVIHYSEDSSEFENHPQVTAATNTQTILLALKTLVCSEQVEC